jgi:2-methylcitrate dehydratase PrpD
VRQVSVAVHELVPKTMRFERPLTGYEGKFSTPFCVATALAERSVKLAHFTDARVRDPGIGRLMARVRSEVHPELHGNDTFLTREFTDVTVELADGRKLSQRVPRIGNRGSRDRPVTLNDLHEKFMDCASGFRNQAGARRLFERLAQLQDVADTREFAACLRS